MKPVVSLTQSTGSILKEYCITSEFGFLPVSDPLKKLPAIFDAWEILVENLPKYLMAGKIRCEVDNLSLLDVNKLDSEAELNRAMLLLSYIGHAYIFGEVPVTHKLPHQLAVPWHGVATRLGRPPVLSYASHALYNWQRFDSSKPVELGNIYRLENFLGGIDEDWFVLVHVDIEGKAGVGLAAVLEAQAAVTTNDSENVQRQLEIVLNTMDQMLVTLRRMPENCDPYIYYNRVRQFIFGWKDNPALPSGVFYDGVVEYEGKPQQFRGETGAQSSIIPTFDAAMGIDYSTNPLGTHLLGLREYMPPRHQEFIEFVANGPSIRTYVEQSNLSTLVDIYNECILALQQFRKQHLEFAGTYIHLQSQGNKANPTSVGTGGTPFMKYLKQHHDELNEYLLS